MTQYEPMVNGLVYDPADEEIMKEQFSFQDRLWQFNQLMPSQFDEKQKYMREVFASCGDNCYIELPLRARGLQYNKDVHIGENAWIGANVVIVPGVRIGENAVIGAGSVVTKDIPDNTLAVGNPCRVLREISQRDKEFFYKNEPIDRQNL